MREMRDGQMVVNCCEVLFDVASLQTTDENEREGAMEKLGRYNYSDQAPGTRADRYLPK